MELILITNTKESKKEKKKKSNKHALEEELGETKDKLIRLSAEFANFHKRTQEEQTQAHSRGVANTLKEFVNVFDDFELALKNAPTSDFKKGVELIFAKFITTAEELGLEKIVSIGEKFDPNMHEVLLTGESDKPSQEIIEELQSGYKVKGKVIRTAKVKVAKTKTSP